MEWNGTLCRCALLNNLIVIGMYIVHLWSRLLVTITSCVVFGA